MKVEVLTLCAFAFVLPQFEAPKNLLWAVYALLWFANRWRRRDFGGPWTAWDSLITAWIASAYLSALYSGLHGAEWKSAIDVLRYGTILWMVRRSGYGERVMLALLGWIVAGTIAALLRGYVEIIFFPRTDGQRRYLGLNSVGHVNHSAIYLTIVFGAVLAWVTSAWRASSWTLRTLGAAVCIGFVLSLFVMESRATVAVALFVAFVVLGMHAHRTGMRPWKALGAAILVVVVVAFVRPEVVEKNSARLKENNLFAHRDSIWRVGIQAWKAFPAFGVGMGNFGKIDYEKLDSWAHARGEVLDRSRFMTQSHAHSLYVNTLAERGLVGTIAVASILLAWIVSLLRTVPGRADSKVRWAYWGGALGAWLVAVLVGFVNTTLHHEHALVSMLLLGGWQCLSGGAVRLPQAPG